MFKCTECNGEIGHAPYCKQPKQPHKWAKEIKAWADGAQIQQSYPQGNWVDCPYNVPDWLNKAYIFRIKPDSITIKGYLILTKLGFTSTVYQSLKGAKAASELYPSFIKIIEVTETIEV